MEFVDGAVVFDKVRDRIGQPGAAPSCALSRRPAVLVGAGVHEPAEPAKQVGHPCHGHKPHKVTPAA